MSQEHVQYQLDLEGLAGIPEGDVSSYDDYDGSFLGTHDTNLFDQNESRLGGGLIDESTGEPINNSDYTGLEDLSFVKLGEDYEGDVLPPLGEQVDLAALWLLNREFGAQVVDIFDTKPSDEPSDSPDKMVA